MTELVAVVGAKGGVGKTTVSLNLGCVLAQAGRQISVVDGDLYTPHISMYLGYTKPAVSIHDVLSCKATLRQALYVHPSGVRVVPGSIVYDDISRVSYAEFRTVLDQLREIGELVIVDAPSGFGSQLDTIMQGVDSVVAVTTPDLPAQADALKSVIRAREMGKRVLGVIVNRARENTDLVGIAAFIGAPIIGTIPDDQCVVDSVFVFHPVVFSYPDSPASRAFSTIAMNLVRGITHG